MSRSHASPATPVAALARWPAASPALAWPGACWSYGELRMRVECLASAASRVGAPDSALVIASRTRRRVVLGVLAAQYLGRPALLLDPGRHDAASCLACVPVGGAIADAGLACVDGLPQVDFTAADAADIVGSTPVTIAPAGDGAGLLVPTSGTTGAARVAWLPARALDAHVAASASTLPPLQAGGRWLVCLPMTTIGALAALWRTLAAGACYAFVERFEADAVRALLGAGATHASVVPAMLEPLVRDHGPPAALRCLLTGGGPLGREAAALARDGGWPLWTGWGMTETASHVVAGPVGSDWVEGVVGRPLPGVTIEVDPGSARLMVGGPMLMAGYGTPGAGLRDDGRFVTSDLGEWLADGRLRILGRADDVIVSAGVNVHPQTVEDVLAACPGVAAVAVTARPHPRWGEVLVALYEGEAPAVALERWARDRLGSAARPREFQRVAALPRNAMGKLMRNQLGKLLDVPGDVD